MDEYLRPSERLAQVDEAIAYYQGNARLIKEGLEAAGYTVYGAVRALSA